MNYPTKVLEREESWKKKFPPVYKEMNFAKYLKNSKKHLDFGCGTGIFTYLLAEKHPKTIFYGTDIDTKMVSLAKKRYVLKNLSFNLDTKIKYDSISCIYVLHHIGDPGFELKKLLANLNDGGKVLILEFRKSTRTDFLKFYNLKKRPESFEEFHTLHNRWTKEQFEQICKSSGLKTLQLKDFGDYWLIYVGEK